MALSPSDYMALNCRGDVGGSLWSFVGTSRRVAAFALALPGSIESTDIARPGVDSAEA
jgi:hypothetical protein